MDKKALLFITFFVEGGLILLSPVLMSYSQVELWPKIGLSWSATAYALLLCIPMLAALYFAIRTRWSPLSRLKGEIEEKIIPIFANCKTFDLAVIAFLAGVGEEIFFRGWLQGVLTSRFEAWSGILIASAIFGLAHYISPTYAIYAFLTGLYLGVIYQAFGNLYIITVIHAVYDFIALMYLVYRAKGQEAGLRGI
jgi:membrane protease YdiL (CAAX protease family)